MKNYWLENNATPKKDWDSPIYLQWLKEIWHVEIEEQARHLWPGQYTIKGWYEHEQEAYKKAEIEWEKRVNEAWKKKQENKPSIILPSLGSGSFTLDIGGEDYFHWNVSTPSWLLHKDGTWNKMLVKNWNDGGERSTYPGIYNYEEACITLGKNYILPPKFEGYDKHLDHVVQNYDYTIGRMRWDL